MADPGPGVLLYAVELRELREWIGCRDESRLRRAWEVVQEQDEDEGWDEDALPVLEKLVRRIVMDGILYDGLDEERRYLVTQVLIDLFDEFVDQESVSEELPLRRLAEAVSGLPRESETVRLAGWLVRGRELFGGRCLWTGGDPAELGPYLGYLTSEESARLAEALAPLTRSRHGKGQGLLRTLRSAAEECARSGRDLVSFVG